MMSDTAHYARMAKAIAYIQANVQAQPSLEQIAEQVHLSPAHFQREFSEWVGTSPKRFLQYLSLDYAKSQLRQHNAQSVLDTAYATGLSSPSRLHDLFVQIEGMTPAEYKHGGKDLEIAYRFAQTLFGEVLIASTSKGICHLTFIQDRESALQQLIAQFLNAQFVEQATDFQTQALAIFKHENRSIEQIKLHLKGTDFQLKVWSSLLKIPLGEVVSYGEVAHDIAQDRAVRAVGSAIRRNPVAVLIPCHRVIQSTGGLGGYRWGTERKTVLIGWEGAQKHAS